MNNTLIDQLKWASAVISVIAAIVISFRLTPVWLAYGIFFIGHVSMCLLMLRQRDWSLFTMNLIWTIIDVAGFINWL
jgi:hypothetical protein